MTFFFSEFKTIVFLAIIFCTRSSAVFMLLLDCPFDGQPDDPSFTYKSIDPQIQQDHVFYLDNQNNTIRMCARITTVNTNRKRERLNRALDKIFVAQFSDMDRGHITPHRFGGSYSINNIIPQNSELNRTTWRQFENQIKYFLSSTMNYVYYTVRLKYDGDDVAKDVGSSSAGVFNRPTILSGTIYDDSTIFDHIRVTNPRGREKPIIEVPLFSRSISERERLYKSKTLKLFSIVGVKDATKKQACQGRGSCSDIHDNITQCNRCCTSSSEHRCIKVEMLPNDTCYQCVSEYRD